MSDFIIPEGRELELLLKEVQSAVNQGKVSFDANGRMVVLGKTAWGGVFDSCMARHEMVQDAIDRMDPEREAWAREKVFALGDHITKRRYFEQHASQEHNLLPGTGLDFAANVIFYNSTTKITNWYQGPFKSNSNPDSTWGPNWANGNLKATELAAADYTAGARVIAPFATASSGGAGVITQSTDSEFTFASGTSGITIYGSTINSSNTVAGTTGTLFAATKFASPKGEFAATDILRVRYSLTVANAT